MFRIRFSENLKKNDQRLPASMRIKKLKWSFPHGVQLSHGAIMKIKWRCFVFKNVIRSVKIIPVLK